MEDAIQAIVQEKLYNDHCQQCLIGQVNTDGSDRILALVEGLGEHAIFVFCLHNPSMGHRPENINLVAAFPVNEDFQYLQETVAFTMAVKLRSRKERLTVLCENDNQRIRFLQAVDTAIDIHRSNSTLGLPSSFSWVEKYTGSTPEIQTPDWQSALLNSTDCHIVADTAQPDHIVMQLQTDLPKMARNADSKNSLDSLWTEVGPASNREIIMNLLMREREDDFTTKVYIKVFCGTWNTNGQAATQSCDDWLARDEEPPDIYAIGFQELDLSKNAYIFTESAREGEWDIQVRRALHPKGKYHKLKLTRLVGMMLIVFVKKDLSPFISEVRMAQVGTGLMGTMGNKGGVAVRMRIHNTTVCFVNSHLAAHTEEFERRNQDVIVISARTNFGSTQQVIQISDHDVVFWIGDLNYRLSNIENSVCKKEIASGNLVKLLACDQLIHQMSTKKVFLDYIEGKITFNPTYKFDTGTDHYDTSEKARTPSWCDRVLWRGPGVQLLAYRSHPSLMISDHKPVSAVFNLTVKRVNDDKYKEVFKEVMHEIDRRENDYLPKVKVSSNEVAFEPVRFMEPQTVSITVQNTGQVPVQFEFINKLDESEFCKPWLNVSPFKAKLRVGEKCDIQFEVFVNPNTAHSVNIPPFTLDDILVLHLDGGKDIFISVHGTYLVSCFGSPLSHLVRLYTPVRDVHTARLLDLGTGSKAPPSRDPFDVPKELYRLVDHLYKYGLKEEDLFFQPGLQSEIQQIRESLDTGYPVKLPGTIHSIANTLLLFIEATYPAVIPEENYNTCLQCRTFDQCKLVLRKIPVEHRNAFKYICAFLRHTLQYQASNKLDEESVARLFSVLLLRPPKQRQLRDKQREINFMNHFLVNKYDD